MPRINTNTFYMDVFRNYVSLFNKSYVIMKSKLTLNVDSELTAKAKAYAKKEGRSLSDLVEVFFSLVTKEQVLVEEEETPRVKRLAGSMSYESGKDFDYKKELEKLIAEKYFSNDQDIS